MEMRLAVPLRDFYNGRDVHIAVEKQQICETCEGSGSADGRVDTCPKCSGRGMIIQKHQLAPGMFQQIQMMCDKCGGQGQTIKKPCSACRGQRVVRKEVDVTVSIEPGMDEGKRVTFENEADESPDWVAGDLVFILEEQEPELGSTDEKRTDGTFFRRKGKDLFWKEVLSLREAWMGDWSRNLTHLDGHVVQLGRKRGQVVQPLSVETVKGEGMPIWHEDHLDHDSDEDGEDEGATHGRLYVEYAVVLPDQMENGMEQDFFALWEKWRKKRVDLGKDSGRPAVSENKDEL